MHPYYMLSMQKHPSRLKMADSFVVEVSLGDIRLKLCSGDDNSFCLKQSAEGIHVDFSCFTGRLCINKNSSSSGSASLSQPLSSEKEDSFENVPVAPAPESAQPTDNTDDSSVGSGETVSLGTWQCDDRTIKHETTPATQESSDHTRSTRICGRRRAFTLPSEFGSSVKMNDSAIWSFQQSVLPARAGSKDDLCCRLKERIESETVNDITSAASEEPTTSDLQGVCALPMVASVRQLQAVLDSNPIAASETDIEGRYPLHILSENEPLLASFLGSKDAEDFCLNLFEAYPEAIIIPDNKGAFPFVHLIKNWVEDSYHRMNQRDTKPRKGLIRTFHSSKGKLNSLFRSDSKYDRTTPETNSKRALFPHVVLTRQVQMSFKILSIYLDRLNESYRQGDFDREANMLVRAAIAESIADIPNVLKTAFLIDDSDKRQWASRCSIIERVCFCTQSTGDWVRNMLKRGGDPSRRAVDYLVQVSGLTVTDYIGPGRSPRLDDTEAYERDRNKVFAALENASPLIPALTVLDSEGKGRAATTDAVWLILNHSLSNPLVVGLLLADFVFSLVLLQTFRYASNSSTQLLYFGGKSSPINNREATTLFLSVCVYFLVRKLSEFYSLLSLSSQAFRSYLANFWNLVDFAAVGMSLSAVLTQTQNAVFLALAMGSLWLKLLGLLRAVNAHLATFILAIQDIVRDIRWFLLVFAIAIFMFADMIHIITIHAQDGNFCKDAEAPSAFCNDVAQVYLKLYAVLMGDVDLEEFVYSSGIEFLFVVFTFMGIIVLLNVLIAIVGDSYKKSVMNAQYLFGRARVDFAVTFVAQEGLLKGSDMPEIASPGLLFVGEHFVWFLGLLSRLVLLILLSWTAGFSMYILGDLAISPEVNTGETIWWSILASIFGVLLLVSVTLVTASMFQRPIARLAQNSNLSGLVLVLNFLSGTAEMFARGTFGVGSPNIYKNVIETDPRVKALEECMAQVSSSTQESIMRGVGASEQRIKANASAVAETFFATMQGMRSDHPGLGRMRHR